MVFFAKNSPFINMVIFLLFINHSCRIRAVILTYDSCMNDTANSYKVGGWCFYIYRNSSWPINYPTQSVAQTMCLPYGNLAIGVTYQMLYSITRHPVITASLLYGWMASYRNGSVVNQGWYWSTLMPNGQYANFPAIYSNFQWYGTEPNNYMGIQLSGIAYANGFADINANFSDGGSQKVAVICQFAPRQWQYPQRGNGRFSSSTFLITQSTAIMQDCLRLCHHHPGCLSVAYNPTTSDCQVYSVSPEDPRFNTSITASSAYKFYIRDGMVY